MASITKSPEWRRILAAVADGRVERIDHPDHRRLRKLRDAIDAASLRCDRYLGDEWGVVAYDESARAAGTALFVGPVGSFDAYFRRPA